MARTSRGSELLQEKITPERTQADIAAELSRRLGRTVHQASVSSWATGRHAPGGQVMIAMLEVLGIPVESWLDFAVSGSGEHPAAVEPSTGTHSR